MGKMSRQKGKRGERAWAKLLTEHGFPAIRGVQFHGGPDSPDVVCKSLPLHFEVKLTERLHIQKAMDQAITDSSFAIPVVAFKQSRKAWLCIIEAEDFFDILKKAYGGNDGRDSSTGHREVQPEGTQDAGEAEPSHHDHRDERDDQEEAR